MTASKSRDEQPRSAQPRRAVPGIDPAIARLSEMLLAMLAQATVIRERLDTVERLIEKQGVFRQSDIDSFTPDPVADAARTALRKRQIQTVMRPLLDDAERTAISPRPAEPNP